MKHEQGFSLIKLMFWTAVLGAGVIYAYMVIPVYNAYWKVQDTFEGVSRSMASASESEIRARLPDLYKIKYLAAGEVPEEFYSNLRIKSVDAGVEISSYYHVTIWFLGPVEGVDPTSDYTDKDLKGMDKIRDRLRQEFDFEPYAKTE
ncbi:MAG: hypothetical protein R8K49_01255 [Mariprofundaceae bacterium]